jgi:hypothetical protein
MKSTKEFVQSKINDLARIEGFTDELALLEHYITDSVCPGICMNPDCDYTVNVEPDSDSGWCEECSTNTVKSAMILVGVI